MFEFYNPSIAAQKNDNDDTTEMNDDTQDDTNKLTTVVQHRESVTEDTKLWLLANEHYIIVYHMTSLGIRANYFHIV